MSFPGERRGKLLRDAPHSKAVAYVSAILRVDVAITTQVEVVSLTCGSRGATRPPVAAGALTVEPAARIVVAGVRKAIRSINELVSLCSVCAVSAVSAKSAHSYLSTNASVSTKNVGRSSGSTKLVIPLGKM